MRPTRFGNLRALTIGSGMLIAAATSMTTSPARAATSVDACGAVLAVAGEHYVLAHDLHCTDASPAITIAANGVSFDLQGHTIDGSLGEGALRKGILAQGVGSITVTNGTVTGFHGGVWLESVSGARVSGVTATECFIGIELKGSMRSRIDHVFAHDDIRGIVVESTTLSQVSDSEASDDTAANMSLPSGGILLFDSDDNTVLRNVARRNAHWGIAVESGSDRNVVQQNVVEDTLAGGYDPQPGIVLYQATENVVRANVSTGNEYGIRVWIGAVGNAVFSNTTTGNGVGIGVWSGASGNRMFRNVATGNTTYDLSDENETCVNKWLANVFGSDDETGLGAGPGTGCIQ